MDSAAIASPFPARPTQPRRLITIIGAVIGIVSCIIVAILITRILRILEPAPLPSVPPVDTFAALFDVTPVQLTITEAWQKVPMVMPAYQLTSDHTVWRKMHVDDQDGTRDVGLGGASDFLRTRMRDLHALGAADVGPDDQQYESPWIATRVVAIWFRLMLDEAGGDLDLAIAAYHTGIADAASDDGQKYAANVRRKRRRFIRNVAAPPGWTFLFKELLREPRIVNGVPR